MSSQLPLYTMVTDKLASHTRVTSQGALARTLAITPQLLNMYLRGARAMPERHARDLAAALDLDEADVMGAAHLSAPTIHINLRGHSPNNRLKAVRYLTELGLL